MPEGLTTTLELGSGGSLASSNVTFAGVGTLQIDSSVGQISDAIVGAGGGDAIDLRFQQFTAGDKVVWTQSSGSAGLMRLETSTGTILASLALEGVYTSAQFTAASDSHSGTVVTLAQPANAAAPGTTTADMIMTDGLGDYEIYDIGGNAIQAAYLLGQAPTSLTFAALGTFQAGDTSDMLLRNASTGAFEAYYVSGNSITGSALVGTVGTDWNFAGTGDFDGQSSLSEMLLRNSTSGSFELYRVAGGGVLSGSSVAAVGNNFTVKGFGFFSESSTTQMMMQGNSGASLGQLELYTYQPSTASFAGIDVGKVGSNLTFIGCADLLGNGSTQMVMQQNNGDLWLYTYNAAANALSGTEVGAVGSNFHVVGFGPLGTAGQDEMLMQDAAGDFEVYQYNAGLNAFVGTAMGTVGAPWTVDGIAATAAVSGASSAASAQLVQAMATMSGDGGAPAGNGSPAITEPTTPTLLTLPQHA